MKKYAYCSVLLMLFMSMSAAMTGCADTDENADATADDPLRKPELLHKRGPYHVGVYETKVTYQPPGQEEARTLPVIVWYPSEEKGNKVHKLTIAGAMPLPNRAYKNLSLAPGAPRPLAIHSHGSAGEASLAYPSAEVFASRGWIVASISHVGNTTLDALGDPLDVPMYIPVYRMLDVSTVIDAAEKGFGLGILDEQIDTQSTFVYGHSFGGYTSLALGGATFLREGAKNMVCENAGQNCEEDDITCGQYNEEACAFLDDPEIVEITTQSFRDPRVQAIGLQAPGALGMLDPSTVTTPTLLMSADQDGWLPHAREAEPIWNALETPDNVWIRFKDAGHLSFITVCDPKVLGADLINQFMPPVGSDGCNPEYTPPTTIADLNTAYLVMFAEKHLLDTARWDDYLSGKLQLSISEDVAMEIESKK